MALNSSNRGKFH